MKYTIEHEEKRAIRRDIINQYLHTCHRLGKKPNSNVAKYFVRIKEWRWFGQELQAYKDFTS